MIHPNLSVNDASQTWTRIGEEGLEEALSLHLSQRPDNQALLLLKRGGIRALLDPLSDLFPASAELLIARVPNAYLIEDAIRSDPNDQGSDKLLNMVVILPAKENFLSIVGWGSRWRKSSLSERACNVPDFLRPALLYCRTFGLCYTQGANPSWADVPLLRAPWPGPALDEFVGKRERKRLEEALGALGRYRVFSSGDGGWHLLYKDAPDTDGTIWAAYTDKNSSKVRELFSLVDAQFAMDLMVTHYVSGHRAEFDFRPYAREHVLKLR